MSQTMPLLILALLVSLASACGSDTNPTSSVNVAPSETVKTDVMPPGFLDEPPPAPTSNTLVLSGGTLIAEEQIDDSVVVVSQGELTAWGQRGAVSMPNDSIGKDMRNKWIVPGSQADLAAGELPNLAHFQAGASTALLIFSEEPSAPWSSDHLVGTLANGNLEMEEEEE